MGGVSKSGKQAVEVPRPLITAVPPHAARGAWNQGHAQLHMALHAPKLRLSAPKRNLRRAGTSMTQIRQSGMGVHVMSVDS